MRLFHPRDRVTFQRDRLIADAKETALGLARAGYAPPRPRTYPLPGDSGRATIEVQLRALEEAHQISAHDRLVGTHLARVLTGGATTPSQPVGEDHLLDLEREAFLSLCGEAKSLERMQHTLTTGKPLRN